MSKGKEKGLSVFYFPIFFLVDIGLLVSIYLTFIHYKVFTDPNYNILACNIGEKFNCRAVAMSSYSLFLNVPISFWGVLFFIGMSVLLVFMMVKDKSGDGVETLFGAFALLSTFNFGLSMVMAYISHAILKVLCLWCMILYVISILLFASIFFISKVKGFGVFSSVGKFFNFSVKNFYIPLILAVVVGGVSYLYPKYWLQSATANVLSSISRGKVGSSYWLGAKEPKATLEIFSDYQCPFCSRAHFFIKRDYLAKYGDKFRLIHRHFPLDKACNPLIKRDFHRYACFMAAIAVCSGEQGKFWEVTDYLYTRGHIEGELNREKFLERVARDLKIDFQRLRTCTLKSETIEKIRRDIDEGLKKYRIRGTPFFVLNGKPYRNGFDKKLRSELKSILEKK